MVKNMKSKDDIVKCRLKEVRKQNGLTQIQLAELVGIKRQAVYDMEIGRYLPNTGVALKLAKTLGCTVEDIFYEAASDNEQYLPATVVDIGKRLGSGNQIKHQTTRVTLSKIKDRFIAYPLENCISADHGGMQAADAILSPCGKRVKLLYDEKYLEKNVLLMGCDPAFSLLRSHVSRTSAQSEVCWRFTSTYRALERLLEGNTHLAGIHLHNIDSKESNVESARKIMGNEKGKIVGFSLFEEGLMVAHSNPFKIKGVDDLADKNIKIVNREPEAALRVLLDDCLKRSNISSSEISGYNDTVGGHFEGANRVMLGRADAALGLRAVALSFGLDFVPITSVRCDLVIPEHIIDLPSVQVILDVMQTKKFRDELSFLPGYETSSTGKVIATL